MPVSLTTFTSGSIAKSAEVNANFANVVSAIRPTLIWSVAETLSTGVNLSYAFIVPLTLTLVKAYAYVKTAPTGADLIVDINKNGTSIWSATPANRLTVGDGSQTGSQTVFDTTSVVENDILTIDIDQIGNILAGAGLTVELKFS